MFVLIIILYCTIVEAHSHIIYRYVFVIPVVLYETVFSPFATSIRGVGLIVPCATVYTLLYCIIYISHNTYIVCIGLRRRSVPSIYTDETFFSFFLVPSFIKKKNIFSTCVVCARHYIIHIIFTFFAPHCSFSCSHILQPRY